MTKKYHTLVVLMDGIWCPQFGDFDKEVVIEEKEEYQGYKCKVITTHSCQKHIDAKVAELNEKLKAVK